MKKATNETGSKEKQSFNFLSIFDWIRNIFFVLAIVLILGAAVCLVMHLKPAVVKSGSMEPTFKAGGVVFINKNAKYDVGDPIAFYVGSNYVTHRITGVGEGGYITQGDANESEDPWQVTDEMIDGKVVFHIPYIGFVLEYAKTKAGIIIIGALVLCLILSMFLSGSNEEKEAEEREIESTIAALKAELEESRNKYTELENSLKTKDEEFEKLMSEEKAKFEESTEKLKAETKAREERAAMRYDRLFDRHIQILEKFVERNIVKSDFLEKEKIAFKPKIR